MSVPEKSAKPHKTRLRDFGAFQPDISNIDTQEMPEITMRDIIPTAVTALQVAYRERDTPTGVFAAREGIECMNPVTPFPLVLNVQQQQESSSHLTLPPPARKSVKKWIGIALRAGITVLLFAFLFKSVSWTELATTLLHSRHTFLLTGLTVGAFGLVVSSYQWHVLMQGEKTPLDLAKLINLYMVGVAFSHFLPTGMGGDAVKALYAGREAGNKEGAVSAVLMSRLTGLIGMLIIAIAALIIWHQFFSASLVEWFVLLSLLVFGMIMGALVFVILLPKFSKKRWMQNRIFATLIKIGKTLLATLRKPRYLSIATVYGMAFWLVGCLNYYTYAIALSIHLPLYFFLVAISLISLLSFLPISINGFGVRESAFVYIFATVHIPTSASLLLALLMDTQVLFFGVLGGLIYLTMKRKKAGVQQRKAA